MGPGSALSVLLQVVQGRRRQRYARSPQSHSFWDSLQLIMLHSHSPDPELEVSTLYLFFGFGFFFLIFIVIQLQLYATHPLQLRTHWTLSISADPNYTSLPTAHVGGTWWGRLPRPAWDPDMLKASFFRTSTPCSRVRSLHPEKQSCMLLCIPLLSVNQWWKPWFSLTKWNAARPHRASANWELFSETLLHHQGAAPQTQGYELACPHSLGPAHQPATQKVFVLKKIVFSLC